MHCVYSYKSLYISYVSVCLSVCPAATVGPWTLIFEKLFIFPTTLKVRGPMWQQAYCDSKASLLFFSSDTQQSSCLYIRSNESSNLVPKVTQCSHFNNSACGFVRSVRQPGHHNLISCLSWHVTIMLQPTLSGCLMLYRESMMYK